MQSSDIVATLKEYLTDSGERVPGDTVLTLLADFVIEKFKQRRSYPSDYTDTQINADLDKFSATIKMAAIDVEAKMGAEGEKSHTENGIIHLFENAYISLHVFADILPFVDFF
jgi:hypothetical protein